MKLCDKCFSMLDSDAMYCSECGAPVQDDPYAEGSDALIYPDIAKANLLRLRGSFDEAEKACLGVLKRFPNNATAHILLGDIHYEKGANDQSRQWFEMALELEPKNALVRSKLDRLQQDERREEIATVSSGLEVGPSGRGPITLFASVIILLVALLGVAYWFGGARTQAIKAGSEDVNRPITIGGMAPAAPPISTVENGVKEPALSAPQTASELMTADETSVLKTIAGQLGALGSRVLALQGDPRTGHVIVTISSRTGASADDDPVEAVRVAQAIFALPAAASVTAVDVRFVEANGKEIRFLCTVTPDSLQAASGEPGSSEWASTAITSAYRAGAP